MATESTLAFQWMFGGAVVVVYAMDRFKSPSPMRATTTFWRYWSAWLGYVTAMLALFVFLGGGFTTISLSQLAPFIGDIGSATDDGTELPGPLLSALILTSLLPHFPLLGKVDTAVKEWFQRVGNMPFEVREMSARLAEASYAPDPRVLPLLLPTFEELRVDAAWLMAAPGSPKHNWATCAALYAQVRRWEGERGYSRFVHEHKTALGEIRSRMNALSEVLEELTLNELERNSDSRIVVHVRKSIKKDIAMVRQALFDFLSAGILNSSWNHHQRHADLSKLGFAGLTAARGPISAHDIVLVIGLVFLALLFIPLMMRRFFDPAMLGLSLRLLIMVPIIYAVAIVSAIYPKSVFPFSTRLESAGRPFAAYALSGAASAAVAFVVSLLFRYSFGSDGTVFQALATPGAFEKAWRTSVERWPWLLMTFFMTVAIAWAADNRPRSTAKSATNLRWIEAASLGVVFCALQWVTIQLLALHTTMQFPPSAGVRMMITALVIGSLIGWFVPHLHRSQGRGTVKLDAGYAPTTGSVGLTGMPVSAND